MKSSIDTVKNPRHPQGISWALFQNDLSLLLALFAVSILMNIRQLGVALFPIAEASDLMPFSRLIIQTIKDNYLSDISQTQWHYALPLCLRFFNFVVHLLIVLSIYFIGLSFSGKKKTAFIGAFLFCISPISVQSINAPYLPLVNLCLLLSTYYLLSFLQKASTSDLMLVLILSFASSLICAFGAISALMIYLFLLMRLTKSKQGIGKLPSKILSVVSKDVFLLAVIGLLAYLAGDLSQSRLDRPDKFNVFSPTLNDHINILWIIGLICVYCAVFYQIFSLKNNSYTQFMLWWIPSSLFIAVFLRKESPFFIDAFSLTLPHMIVISCGFFGGIKQPSFFRFSKPLATGLAGITLIAFGFPGIYLSFEKKLNWSNTAIEIGRAFSVKSILFAHPKDIQVLKVAGNWRKPFPPRQNIRQINLKTLNSALNAAELQFNIILINPDFSTVEMDTVWKNKKPNTFMYSSKDSGVKWFIFSKFYPQLIFRKNVVRLPSEPKITRLLVRRLKELGETGIATDRLSQALVIRFDPPRTINEARIYSHTSRREGFWTLGTGPHDRIISSISSAGEDERLMYHVYPQNKYTIGIIFPRIILENFIRITSALEDTPLAEKPEIIMKVILFEKEIGNFLLSQNMGKNLFEIDTRDLSGKETSVAFFFFSDINAPHHVQFNFSTQENNL